MTRLEKLAGLPSRGPYGHAALTGLGMTDAAGAVLADGEVARRRELASRYLEDFRRARKPVPGWCAHSGRTKRPVRMRCSRAGRSPASAPKIPNAKRNLRRCHRRAIDMWCRQRSGQNTQGGRLPQPGAPVTKAKPPSPASCCTPPAEQFQTRNHVQRLGRHVGRERVPFELTSGPRPHRAGRKCLRAYWRLDWRYVPNRDTLRPRSLRGRIRMRWMLSPHLSLIRAVSRALPFVASGNGEHA